MEIIKKIIDFLIDSFLEYKISERSSEVMKKRENDLNQKISRSYNKILNEKQEQEKSKVKDENNFFND